MLRESAAMALQVDEEDEGVWVEEVTENGQTRERLCRVFGRSKVDKGRKDRTFVIRTGEDSKMCPVALFQQWNAIRDRRSKMLFHDEELANTTPNGCVQTG